LHTAPFLINCAGANRSAILSNWNISVGSCWDGQCKSDNGKQRHWTCDQADREADATMGPLAESAGNQEADANKVELLIVK